MQEQEYKLLLTAEQYRDAADALTHSASRENPYIQINYYFDTEDFELYKSGRTLRVREKDSRLQLQYKSANQGAGDLYEREEKSIPLLELPSQLIPAHYFPNISAAIDCRYIGSLTTLRQNFLLPSLTISLDCNHYLGRVDYEIEVELKGPDATETDDRIHNGSPANRKYERFMQTYVSMRETNPDVGIRQRPTPPVVL